MTSTSRSAAHVVDFGGWDMPVHYGSQIEEHHAVRRSAGVFDVSHMCVIDVHGTRSGEFLRGLLANDVARLRQPGKALYSCMLREDGGILDDLIVYFLDPHWYRVVVNAGTRDSDLAWIRAHAGPFNLDVQERGDLAMLAVQGPEARPRLSTLLTPPDAQGALALPTFFGAQLGAWFVARTGYTGEDGFEIMLPADGAAELWNQLNELGVQSCGLGARDLRLEAGMNLWLGNGRTAAPIRWNRDSVDLAFEPAGRDGRAAPDGARQVREKAGGPAAGGARSDAFSQRVLTAAGEGGHQRHLFADARPFDCCARPAARHRRRHTVQVDMRKILNARA
jgi:aminomethyltransferase